MERIALKQVPIARRWVAGPLAGVLLVLLAACSGGDSGSTQASLASGSDIAAESTQPGVTPFISFVQFRGTSMVGATAVRYVVEPKSGAASRPVDVTYAIAALKRRGYVGSSANLLVLPVFGLYAGSDNHLSVEFHFRDLSVQRIPVDVTTTAYVDPAGTYVRPLVHKRRSVGSALGFDYFALKPAAGGPVVVDSDGELRWVGLGPSNSYSSAFRRNGFVVGEQGSTKLSRLELDGSASQVFLISPTITSFHHNIDPGKQGVLAEVNSVIGGATNLETTLVDVTDAGAVVKEWDFAALLGAYMLSQGDDPSNFVRPGADWFHMNAATYDPRDDSVIVSSRENFVIKVRYQTGEIVWILGDPTKYWYTFPSLRAKALTLESGGLYPIGQHATSVTADGLILLFNDGGASFNQPAGAPVGESRSYSAVSAYAIDQGKASAKEVWRFDNAQSILSDICSSAYESPDGSLLINYAAASNRTTVRLVALAPNRDVVFDFQYASAPCTAGWNAVQVPFEHMHFQ